MSESRGSEATAAPVAVGTVDACLLYVGRRHEIAPWAVLSRCPVGVGGGLNRDRALPALAWPAGGVVGVVCEPS